MTVNKVAEVSAQYLAELDVSVVPAGYKKTEVGVIPEDWDVLSLGHIVARLESGVSVNSLDSIEAFSHGMHVLKTSCVSKGYFHELEVKSILPKDVGRAKCPVKKGSIIVSRMNTPALVGELGFVPNDNPNSFLPDRLWQMSLLGERGVDSKWLAYFLSYPLNSQRIKESATGTSGSMKNISKDSFLSLSVSFPQPKEQTAIANALSDIDALVSELEKLIAKKQAIKTATMQQLLTGRTRLPQFALREDGSKKGYKQSELGEIPENWEVSNISGVSLVPMQNGLFYEPKRKGSGVPLINVGDMYEAAPIDVDSLELFDATSSEIKVFRVSAGDLFFTRSSVVPSGIAFCNIYDSARDDVVFDSHLIRVRPNTEIVDPKYFYLNCISKHARTALISEAKTATMTTIDQGAINRCPVLLPLRAEQTAIADTLSDMESEIQALQQRLSKTRQIKQGMMQELLTGKTRLIQPAGSTN